MDLYLTELKSPPIDRLPVEIVERKGLGHPDTICDALAEELSRALCRFYLDRFGFVAHHNVDKALLWGGASRPAFGGGVVLEPMEIFLAGRATLEYKGVTVPVAELVDRTARVWFRNNMHAVDAERHIKTHCLVRPGSSELVDLFEQRRKSGAALANDTSCGVGFAPLSDLERTVLAVERDLNRPGAARPHPEHGEDIKVMGVRRDRSIDLTVACALVDAHVADLHDYKAKKAHLSDLARDMAMVAAGGGYDVSVTVNAADDPAAGDIYLTVTGTSAESGDDGQVGRGNRANGLITPYRPMTLEAAAGKNPVTHVGKLYNIAAGRIAAGLVERLSPVRRAHCLLVSRIGHPVSDPALANVELELADGASATDMRSDVEQVVREQLAALDGLYRDVVDGAVGVY